MFSDQLPSLFICFPPDPSGSSRNRIRLCGRSRMTIGVSGDDPAESFPVRRSLGEVPSLDWLPWSDTLNFFSICFDPATPWSRGAGGRASSTVSFVVPSERATSGTGEITDTLPEDVVTGGK